MPNFDHTHVQQLTSTSVGVNTIPLGGSGSLVSEVVINDVKEGQSLKNYRDLIAQGKSATTGYLRQTVKIEPRGGSCGWTYRNPGNPDYIVSQEVSGNALLQIGSFDQFNDAYIAAENDAKVKAANSLRKGSVQGLSFLGELRETIQMIKRPASAARALIEGHSRLGRKLQQAYASADPRRRPHLARDAADALAGSWLEVQFGWKPLVNDISDIVNQYNQRLNHPPILRFSGRGSSNAKFPRTVTASYGNFDHFMTYDVEYGVRYKGAARLKCEGGGIAFGLGFTMPDIIPSLWELMPWSFAIDYFSNIGDILNTNATLSQVEIIYSTRTVRQRVVGASALDTHSPLDSFTSATGSGCYMGWELFKLKRDGTPPSAPRFRLESPLPSSNKWLNLGALFTQFAAATAFNSHYPR